MVTLRLFAMAHTWAEGQRSQNLLHAPQETRTQVSGPKTRIQVQKHQTVLVQNQMQVLMQKKQLLKNIKIYIPINFQNF